MSAAMDDLATFLNATLGDTEGQLHTAIGIGPHTDATGRHKHRRWTERRYPWPAQRDRAVADLLAAAEDSDVYACPYPMVGDKRAQGAAAARRIAHADVDGDLDVDKARRLGAIVVGSGTPGHGHGYVALTESVPAVWHRELCRALGAYLGDADAKISDNDVLRPPGTLNHKRGQERPVVWLIRPPGRVWDPRELAAELAVTLPDRTPTRQPAPAVVEAVEAVDLEDHPAVTAAVAHNSGDRSIDTMRIVGACHDAGLTLDQARHVVSTRTDLADRLAGRTDDDVAACWDKAKQSRAAQVVDVAAPATGAPAEVHRGQARIAYRVADRYRDRLLHVAGLGWHTWDGARYIPDQRGAATRAVLAELRRTLAQSIDDKDLRADVRKCESAAGVTGVLALAGALEPLAAAVPDVDADPHLLNVANGTLDLRTLELRPYRPADRITKVCRGAYTPGAESQAWQAFLARVLPDADVRRFVQRLVGVGLLGAVREHILSIWTGTGANGKSVMDKAIRFALGDYAATAEPDLFMHRDGAHPTGEMDLRGVRWVAVSESEKDRRLAEATMKRLTGGDTIRARRMRQDFVEFTPSHTPVLITNHLPRVSGDDPAIWRRIRVVPFDVVIPDAEQDPGLDDRLALEADAILTWAVAGYREYLDRGLDEPAGVLVATDDYHRNSDAVARFVEECCHTSAAVKSVTGQLFDAWERWRAAEGAEPISLKAFGMALTNKGYPADKKSVNGRKWRHGIALRAVEENGTEDA